MPNGHRRGGQYTRNGRTHYRRGTTIAPPATKVAAITGVVGGIMLISGYGAMPILGGILVAGALAYAGRRPLHRTWRATARHRRQLWRKHGPKAKAAVVTYARNWAGRPDPQPRRASPRGAKPAHVPPEPLAGYRNPDQWATNPNEPATQRQRHALAQLGVDIYPGMTKAAASKVIKSHEIGQGSGHQVLF